MSEPPTAAAKPSSGMPSFEAVANAAIRRGEIPGIVAIAADADRVLYQRAIGDLGVPGKGPLAVDDVFYIASMTKPITCFAGAQMVERGKLRLDQNAADILPELGRVKVLAGFDAAGKPILRDPVRQITIRHLFTHSSGFSTDVWNEGIRRYCAGMGVPGMSTCRDAALAVPLILDPGTRWEYSVSIDFIGKIVERVSGQRLEEYFRDNIFRPLGMGWTSFIISPAQRARLVPVRARTDAGRWEPVAFEISQEPEFYMGGAGLYGSAGDYIRFLMMLLNKGTLGGNRVMQPETVDLFFADHLGELELPILRTAMPSLSADVDFNPGIPKTWSLAALVNKRDVPGGRGAGSQFWAGLASSYFWVDPRARLAGAVFMSSFPFADPTGLTVFDALEHAVYDRFGKPG
jgi:CubicO group peptidase (beta-lactamase class C family)